MSNRQTSIAKLHGHFRFLRRRELPRETTYTPAFKRPPGRPGRRLHFSR